MSGPTPPHEGTAAPAAPMSPLVDGAHHEAPEASAGSEPIATDAAIGASGGDVAGESEGEGARDPLADVQVFTAPEGMTPAAAGAPEPDASFFEPTIADVQMMHAGISGRSQQLNNAPLLTNKHREAERAARDAKKATRWPNATIRIKFSDGTQIQSVFPSTSPIQPVYAFVRGALAASASEAAFTLYQPPRTTFPEHPVPQSPSAGGPKHPNPAMRSRVITPANYGPVRGAPAAGLQGGTGGKESLSELGLVPQSVLLVKFDNPDMNRSDAPAPLRDELRAKAAPLPPPQPKENVAAGADRDARKDSIQRGGAGAEKKMPKWLQKGLLKKKT